MIDSIAKSYANALIELLDESKVSIKDSIEELQIIEKIVSDDEISRFLEYPNIYKSEKLNVIKDALSKYKFDKTIVSFIEVLVNNNRILELNNIIDACNEYLDNLNSVVRVEIISNKNLKEKTLKNIIDCLKKEFKKDIIANVLVDEAIIGGIVVKRNGYILDASILSKLKSIKETVIYGE